MPTEPEELSLEDRKRYEEFLRKQHLEIMDMATSGNGTVVQLEVVQGLAFVAEKLQASVPFYRIMMFDAENVMKEGSITPSWLKNTGVYNPALPVAVCILDQFNPDFFDGYMLQVMGYDINGMMYQCCIPVNREKWNLIVESPGISWTELLKLQHEKVMGNVIVASHADMQKITRLPFGKEAR